MPVPVHVVAGFLGAGKTTLVRALLAQLPLGERVGLVVNDFGEAAIDEALLADGGELREIRGACVCCSAPEGFVAAVQGLLDAGVSRILVEPTGLARPADLIDTLRRGPVASRVELRPLIVLVDPAQLAAGAIPEDLVEQCAAADVLVANRVDRATGPQLEAFAAWAEALWPGPHAVLRTTFGRVDASVLDWPAGRGPRASGAHDHDHDHDHAEHAFRVRSFAWPPEVTFHRGRLRAAFAGLDAARAKGLFRTDEGVFSLQRAGGAVDEAPSGRRSDSRCDVIVAADRADTLDAAAAALDAALLRPEEAARRGVGVEVVVDGVTRTLDRAALAALPEGVPDVSVLVPKRAGIAARLPAVLGAVGAPSTGSLVVVASDGYVTPPVALADLTAALLVHALGDGPLPADQGGPFRLLIPGDAGPGGPCANVKGVVRLVVR